MARKFNPEKRIKYLMHKAMRATKVDPKGEYLIGMAKKMSKSQTKPERMFESLLKELHVKYEKQKIVGGKIYDFYLVDINLLFEIDGNYWHAKDLEMGQMNEIQRRSVKNDWYKESIARAFGYQFERLWESDLEDNYEGCKMKVRSLFN